MPLELPNSLFPIKTIDNAYQALIKAFDHLKVSENCGTNEQWMRLLDMYQQKPNEVQQYFSEYENNETEIYEHIVGDAYRVWMYFVNLKMFSDKIQNSYLQYVIYDTNNAEELKNKILIDIIGIPHTDKRFKEYYQNRKKLLKSFPESELAYFVSENQIDLEGEIYNYTDTTVLEKRQIVNWISNHGWSDLIPELYPQLGMYMKKYIFNCGSISDQLTEYFELYKLQKIQNRIEDRFLDLVDEYGKKYLYTKLPTRDSAINKIDDKQATYLYWVDALGVEYLSYIIGMANKRGLSVKVDITRADLPTITSINKSFYENWHGNLKYKEEDLDNTKHKEKGGFFYTQDKTPVHIIRELEIIEKAVDAAVSSLASHKCKQFVIASDHGASRLAVIKEKENPHQTDTKGEHSGRCCKAYDEDNREYLVEENGYFVRTDYERYAGSRAANVEVHGGATLEEIVVPVITLSLKRNQDVDIRVLNAEKITADRRDGTYVEFYISYVEQKENVNADEQGVISPEELKKVLSRPRDAIATCESTLVSVMLANNEIGTIQPIEELSEVAREYGARFHTDAVQAVGHIPIDVKQLGVSMLSASAHKFNGPKGIGFLYSTGGIPNLIDGGAQEKGHRAGTENVAAIVGMAVALEKNCMEMKANTEKILGLEQLLVNRLDTSGLDYIRNGVNQLPGNISLSFANAEGEMILHRMDLKKICISTGSACDSVNTQVSHVIKAIGVPEKYAKGTIRISFGKNNSEEEVLTIADTLIKILKV